MATRNSARFVAEALASIGPSIGDDVSAEVLVADGSSDDDTVALAEADRRVRVVSRSDNGIYDGMNRAFSQASGDFVLFLNSDDALIPGAVATALQRLAEVPNASWVSAPALFGATIENAIIRLNHRQLSVQGAMFGVPAFNSRIFRRDFLVTMGPIRDDLGLAADREYMARIAASGCQGISIDKPLYLYRVHEGSHTISGDNAGRMRVYKAELKLATLLVGDPRTSDPLRRLARASGAVAATKLRLTNGPSGQAVSSEMNFSALVHGLWLTKRWRGQLSGY